MRRSIRSAVVVAAALTACAGRAAGPDGATPREADVAAGAATAPPTTAPAGRPAGMTIIDFGNQRTLWQTHCPTDSPSPLRQPCSMTRTDVAADGEPPHPVEQR
jgi:hypothetical protein